MRALSLAIVAMAVCSPVAADEAGSMPGDDELTCEQIAAQLMSYADRIRGTATALGENAQEIQRRGEERMARGVAEVAADSAAAAAASQVPGGGAAMTEAQAERQRAEAAEIEAEDAPLTQDMASNAAQLAAQGQAMQNDPRFQRLMQLAQEKDCH